MLQQNNDQKKPISLVEIRQKLNVMCMDIENIKMNGGFNE